MGEFTARKIASGPDNTSMDHMEIRTIRDKKFWRQAYNIDWFGIRAVDVDQFYQKIILFLFSYKEEVLDNLGPILPKKGMMTSR